MKLKLLCVVACLLLTTAGFAQAAQSCRSAGVWLQVLGSGGPELTDGRASSSYLVWQDGRARILVDMGPGSTCAMSRAVRASEIWMWFCSRICMWTTARICRR